MKVKDIKNGMRVVNNEDNNTGIIFYFKGWGTLFISDEPSLKYHDSYENIRKRVMKICPQFKSHDDFSRRCWWVYFSYIDPLPIDLDEDDNECV